MRRRVASTTKTFARSCSPLLARSLAGAQPKQIFEIKNFVHISKRPDSKCKRASADQRRRPSLTLCRRVFAGVKIRKVKGAKGAAAEKTKFKLRTSKYLYTLVSSDAATTSKIVDALPPSALLGFVCSRTAHVGSLCRAAPQGAHQEGCCPEAVILFYDLLPLRAVPNKEICFCAIEKRCRRCLHLLSPDAYALLSASVSNTC